MSPQEEREVREALAELAQEIASLAETVREHIEHHDATEGDNVPAVTR